MQVNDKLLTKLEKLSFLKIDEDKREGVIKELSEIIRFVDNLKELDTSKVDSNFAISDDSAMLREDRPKCDKKINESIIKYAPLSGDNFFIVPKIIE